MMKVLKYPLHNPKAIIVCTIYCILMMRQLPKGIAIMMKILTRIVTVIVTVK